MALGAASVWMVLGRASGLVWTVLLISTLGIGEYGRYAAAYAIAAILSAPIENIFVVRCVRVSEREYLAERSLRALIGAGLAIIGIAVYSWSFVAGFALLVAGLEMIFNAYKSVALRAGYPGVIMKLDAFRQIASILLAAAYLFTQRGTATLEAACLVYLVPYVVVIVMTVKLCWGHRPGISPDWRQQGVLLVDAVVISLYLQGDILLLGLLTNNEIVGIYSVASQLALAASTIGQLFGQQYVAGMREQPNNAAVAPPLKLTIAIGAVLWVGTMLVALVLIAFTEYHEIGWALLVIAPFAALRSITNTWVTVLYVRGLDTRRIVANAVALGIRFLLLIAVVLALAPHAAIIAALCAVIGEIILAWRFFRLVKSSQTESSPVEGA